MQPAPSPKGRIFLFHWKDTEIEALAAPLRDGGWQVDSETQDGARGGKAVIENPPEAVVFYLTRLPSHSRHTAEYIHRSKPTRHLPLVFVDGKEDAVEKTRAKIPSGIFTTSEALLPTLEQFTSSSP
jgi:glutaredoxin